MILFLIILAIAGVTAKAQEILTSENDPESPLPQIKFYYQKYVNYSPLEELFTSRITTSCANLPGWTWPLISSIISDKCALIYSTKDCENNLKSITRIKAGTTLKLKPPTVSFRSCEDITDQSPYLDLRVRVFNDSKWHNPFLDIPVPRSCENLPLWARKRVSSVDNDACINFYSELDCETFLGTRDAGKSSFIGENIDKSIISIRPCDVNKILNPKYHRLEVNILEFNIKETSKGPQGTEEIIKFPESTKQFTNFRGSPSVHSYSASKTFTEMAIVERRLGNNSFHTFRTDDNTNFEFSNGVKNANAIIKDALITAYSFTKDSDQKIEIKSELSKEMEFNLNVTIPPCMSYNISAVAKGRIGQLFFYVARAHVKGKNVLGNDLSADEILKLLTPDFKFIKNVDEGTIKVKFNNTLKAKYIQEANIITDKRELNGCRNDCNKLDGFYQLAEGKCGDCHELCSSCNGSRLNECVKCRLENNGSCVKNCPEEKKAFDGKCLDKEEVEKRKSNTKLFLWIGIPLGLIVVGVLVAIYFKFKRGKSAQDGKSLNELNCQRNEMINLLNMENEGNRNNREITQIEIGEGIEFRVWKVSGDSLNNKLDKIKKDVAKLEAEVNLFEGPHFTKVYRTLQGDCGKLQIDLDKMNLDGRDDIRKERRKLYAKIEELSDQLAGRAHSDGNICEGCEVKE